jgi:hypothetical protein
MDSKARPHVQLRQTRNLQLTLTQDPRIGGRIRFFRIADNDKYILTNDKSQIKMEIYFIKNHL